MEEFPEQLYLPQNLLWFNQVPNGGTYGRMSYVLATRPTA